MIHGFDVDSPLVCEGIIGDGCGGGRFFFVEDNMLLAYDPVTESKTFLADNIKDAKIITKKACVITIECKETVVKFDLSKLQMV